VGTVFDKLKFDQNTEVIVKKSQQSGCFFHFSYTLFVICLLKPVYISPFKRLGRFYFLMNAFIHQGCIKRYSKDIYITTHFI